MRFNKMFRVDLNSNLCYSIDAMNSQLQTTLMLEGVVLC